MWEVVGELMSPAVGVILSPMPIAGIILMLLSPQALKLAPAFVAGWLAVIAVTLGVMSIFVDADTMIDSSDSPSTFSIVMNIVLGSLMILLAFNAWRGRPKPGETPEMPGWMKAVDKVSVPMAFLLGAMFGGVNPKNLLLNIAAGKTIVAGALNTSQTVSSIVIYAVIASLSVIVPLAWYLASPESAAKKLDGLRGWLTENNATVMTVVFLVLGVNYVGKGIGGL